MWRWSKEKLSTEPKWRLYTHHKSKKEWKFTSISLNSLMNALNHANYILFKFKINAKTSARKSIKNMFKYWSQDMSRILRESICKLKTHLSLLLEREETERGGFGIHLISHLDNGLGYLLLPLEVSTNMTKMKLICIWINSNE